MTHKSETWKTYGKVFVTRNSRGRFVTWHQIKPRGIRKRRQAWISPAVRKFGKRIAVYGVTINRKGKKKKNRIELYGSGKEQYRAIRKLHEGWIPKEPYHVVDAEDTDDFIERGRWLKIEVVS